MKIAIVDDEMEIRTLLSGYIERFAKEHKTHFQKVLFESGDELLKKFESEYDLIIFDVDMPGTNGIDTARKIREMDKQVVILFVTNMAQYAINGYEVEAVDYILKPIGYYDFAMKFQRALHRVERKKPQSIILSSTDGPVKLDVVDVYFVEVLAHYLIYHTKKRNYQVRGSMREQEKVLREYQFCRVHKSYLVNLRRIENIGSAELIVGGETVPLGRSYKDSFMSDYMTYLRE